MLFRAATADDLSAILALLVDDELGKLREDLGPPLDPRYLEGFAAIARDPNQLLAVAEQDGEVVGCLQLTFIPGLSRRGMWRPLRSCLPEAIQPHASTIQRWLTPQIGVGMCSPGRA